MIPIVEEGKTVYIGARKFIEGDIIPPEVNRGVEIIVNNKSVIDESVIPQKPKKEEDEKPKRKRSYRSRKGSVI